MILSIAELEILNEALEYRMIEKENIWWNDKERYSEIADSLTRRLKEELKQEEEKQLRD